MYISEKTINKKNKIEEVTQKLLILLKKIMATFSASKNIFPATQNRIRFCDMLILKDILYLVQRMESALSSNSFEILLFLPAGWQEKSAGISKLVDD